MPRRPSLRAVLATSAAAALLVGRANLASYATTHHGHHGHHGQGASAKSSAAKTLVFHLGSPGQKFAGGSTHFFSAKVPKGTYEASVSGIVLPANGGTTSDNISCVLVDKKTLNFLLHHLDSIKGGQRLYAFLGSQGGDSNFGFMDQTNPAARVDRPNIVWGCTFNSAVPFNVVRPLVFTLRPTKVTNEKNGKPFHLPASKVRDLARSLR